MNSSPATAEKKRILIAIFAVVGCVVIALYLANPRGVPSADPRARLLGYTVFRVASSSMLPSYTMGDILLLEVSDGPFSHGQAIIYQPPGLPQYGSFLGRVVGLPGDDVAIQNGVLYRNGEAVREDYVLLEHVQSDYSQTLRTSRVPEEHLLLLGDYRDNSFDSRDFGFVPTDNVIGVAGKTLWSEAGDG